MRHSEEMETQGLTQEAYIALQRGIMSLEDAVDGKVGKYREEIDALSPSEKIMFEDQRNRNIEKGGGGGKTKRGKKGKTQTREGKVRMDRTARRTLTHRATFLRRARRSTLCGRFWFVVAPRDSNAAPLRGSLRSSRLCSLKRLRKTLGRLAGRPALGA
jgi:hypothetical protein